MDNKNTKNLADKSVTEWKKLVADYQKPNLGRATWQITNTLGSVLIIWILLYLTLTISWWLTIGLSLLGGLFLVRAFIIFHDCGHGSFFKSKKANNILWLYNWHAYIYPISPLEMGARNASCNQW